MKFIGNFAEDATVNFFFTTNDGDGAAVAPSSAFEAADITIYKDNSATQKTSTNGLTMTSPFDSIVGLHLISIDTSNDTGDAGFWVTGSDFTIVLNPDETVDTQTVVSVLGQFAIENRVAGSGATAAAIADAVWDETQSAHTTAGTFGETATEIAALQTDLDNGTDGLGAIKTAVDAIPTTAMRGTDGANTTTPPTVGAIADQVWDEAQSAHVAAGSFGIIATEIATLQTDLDNGTDGLGALKTLIDAIQTDLDNGTDGLGALKALIDTVNTDLSNGTDGLGAIKTAVDAIPTSNPTAASVADAVWDEAKSGHTGSGSFGEEAQLHALSSEISALNDLSAAAVNAEMVDALATDSTDAPAGAPPASASMQAKLGYLYASLRNPIRVGSSGKTFQTAGGAVQWVKGIGDDGSTYFETLASTST